RQTEALGGHIPQTLAASDDASIDRPTWQWAAAQRHHRRYGGGPNWKIQTKTSKGGARNFRDLFSCVTKHLRDDEWQRVVRVCGQLSRAIGRPCRPRQSRGLWPPRSFRTWEPMPERRPWTGLLPTH